MKEKFNLCHGKQFVIKYWNYFSHRDCYKLSITNIINKFCTLILFTLLLGNKI